MSRVQPARRNHKYIFYRCKPGPSPRRLGRISVFFPLQPSLLVGRGFLEKAKDPFRGAATRPARVHGRARGRHRPASRLTVTTEMAKKIDRFLVDQGIGLEKIALIHPAAAFATKQWPAANFARVVEFVNAQGFRPVLVAAPKEKHVIEEIRKSTGSPFHRFWNLSLPEITALASR